jgi:hypothetical protein
VASDNTASIYGQEMSPRSITELYSTRDFLFLTTDPAFQRSRKLQHKEISKNYPKIPLGKVNLDGKEKVC